MTAETLRTGRVLVPAPICEAFGRANEIHAQRGQATHALKLSLAAWLTRHGPVPDPGQPGTLLDAATVQQWRGAAPLRRPGQRLGHRPAGRRRVDRGVAATLAPALPQFRVAPPQLG